MDLAQRTAFVPDELEALLKFIPSPQLLKFRSVSKEWDEVAKMVLRKRRDIKLLLTTDNFDNRFNWDFFEFLNDSPENAFGAPVLYLRNININQLEQHLEEGRIISFQIMRKICKILGNRGIFKELIIEDRRNARHFTSDFVLVLLSHLSTLEKLEIKELWVSGVQALTTEPKFQFPCLRHIHIGCEYGSDEKATASLLKIIIESSPNLKKITGESDAIEDLHPLNIITLLMDTGRLSKMKEIPLIKAAELDILLQCKPKIALHSFTIHSIDTVDSNKLFVFLQQQARSLKTLKCEGNSLAPKSVFTLPVLPVLEKLSLKPENSGCFLSVNYGRHTPALKTLKISSKDDFHAWEDFLSYKTSGEMPPCLSLEEMKLSIKGPTRQNICHNWKSLFPNIKKLSLGNAWQFEIEQITKCWPNLEELAMYIDNTLTTNHEQKDLDEIVFGISPDWKGKIDTTEQDWWVNIPAPEIKATVANLKSLKKLKVEGWRVGMCTDFAVYFGLRHLQNLEDLDICTSGSGMRDGSGVSAEASNFLVKNLPKLEKLYLEGQVW